MIKKRKRNNKTSKRYHYDFHIKGKRYRGSCYTTNKEEAITYAENIRKNIYAEVMLGIVNRSFAEMVEFYESNSTKELSRSRKYQYKKTTSDCLSFFKNRIYNKENIYSCLDWIKNSRNLSVRTVKKEKEILRSIDIFCFQRGFTIVDTFKDMDFKEINKSANKIRISYLSKDEYNKLIRITENKNIQDYIIFSINTGLRLGEQLSISWEQINFARKELLIKAEQTKTKKERLIPLPAEAINILNKRLDLPYPFKISKSTLHHQWALAKNNSNIRISWHDLRHTFATWALQGLHSWQKNPMSITKISAWLGHINIKETMKYAHLSTTSLKEEINDDL